MRNFELKLYYKSDAGNFNVDAIDTIIADSFVSLLAQFMILIGAVHRRIIEEERSKHGSLYDDDVPF